MLLHHRARIFKRLRSSGIDSDKSIPQAYVAWRAGKTTISYSVPSPHRLFKNSRTDQTLSLHFLVVVGSVSVVVFFMKILRLKEISQHSFRTAKVLSFEHQLLQIYYTNPAVNCTVYSTMILME